MALAVSFFHRRRLLQAVVSLARFVKGAANPR
jgi:hypothetical protein